MADPSDPVIVPPPATINQADSPEEIQRVGENVQKIFDKVTKHKPFAAPAGDTSHISPSSPAPPVKQEPATPTSAGKAPQAPEPEAKAADTQRDAPKVPSFIEKALAAEPVKAETAETAETAPPAAPTPAEAIEEWPEELPQEQKQSRIRGLRDAYKTLKEEVKTLRERSGLDEPTRQKLEYLENRNKEMETVLARTNVEHHQEFQNKILRPMHAAWNEAARIVQETGGDPSELSKALALSGKAHFEALDTIFADMPESAKIEANNAIAAYRRSDSARRQWLENAPRMAEELKKNDLQRQYEEVGRQKAEMKLLWEEAGRTLRDDAKVEIMLKSNDPDAAWWNEQADYIEKTSEDLFLNNTDMRKVAFAMRLAPMVDPYRKLWLAARAEVEKLNGVIQEKFGSEPSLSESGGNVRNGVPTPEEDLKKPFKDVFLREFHKARNAGMR